jgi:hypothetical protein
MKYDAAHADPIDGKQYAAVTLIDERKREVAPDPCKKLIAAIQPCLRDGSAERFDRLGAI